MDVPTPQDRHIDDHRLLRWSTAAGRALGRLVLRTQRWSQANVVLAITLVVALGFVVGTTALAGEVYEAVAEADGIALLDRPLLDWILGVRTPRLDSAIAFYSNTGGPVLQPIITGAVALFLAWRWRSRTPVVLAAVASAGALVMTLMGKTLVGRGRPPLEEAIPPFEHSPSFPSGHTLIATVIAGIVCYLLLHWFRTRRVRLVWIALLSLYAVTMGLSRVYLGHHWLTDVVVGWLLGLAWVSVVVVLHRLWLVARAKHGEQRWNTMLGDRDRVDPVTETVDPEDPNADPDDHHASSGQSPAQKPQD
ncbi:MAG TPA: phosphatase PAP2 family protein [Propionibacterium sp.]|nr:phosphatase PAP2 family protein [Propionibacterium sp.]